MSLLVTFVGIIGRVCFWIGILIAIASITTAIGALAYPPNPPPNFWRYDFPILASCGLWAVVAVAVGWVIRYVLSGPSRRLKGLDALPQCSQKYQAQRNQSDFSENWHHSS
jgi:hypothetical protein